VRQQTTGPIELAGREQILAATGHHPYARLTTTARDVRGFACDEVIVWLATWSRGTVASASGDPRAALEVLAQLDRRGDLATARRVNVERIDHGALRHHFGATKIDDWDFRWTRTPPPLQPGEERVTPLEADDEPAVAVLLERAFPETFTRPGDTMVRCWYGIREGDRLVACGADRSRGGVGSISAVTVDPAARGQGLGASLTAAMTRQLLGECDVVTLGVMSDNQVAGRLYRRLGFADAILRTSANLVR
jgi:ribosomal protein S18 acetylase RimI-like enzyme